MQFTEQELGQLIKSLEVEFSAHIADLSATAQPAPLAKAEDEKSAEDSKKEDKAEESKESKPETEESKEESKADGEQAAEGKEEAAAAPAAPSEEQPTGEAPVDPQADIGLNGYDAEDIAQMDQMYLSMSREELLAHHDSCVRALDSIGAEHSHAAAAAAPAAEMDKCGEVSMMKSEEKPASIEVSPEVIKNTEETEILKSEVEAHKAKNAELQKSLDTVSEILTKLVKKAPQGKAITALEQVAKSEGSTEEKQLTKSEITAILTKKSADPTLSKNDRDAINAYYINNTNVNTISHLLK